MERRRSHRLYTSLPIEYRVILQGQASQSYCQATMKNISQGGAYLECGTQPRLSQGQIGHFTFRSSAAPEDSGCMYLGAKGIVRRIECPKAGGVHFGFAVEFLSGPLIFFDN